MTTSIIYSSSTGNTKSLAERIQSQLGADIYCGPITDEALAADVIYIGFWTMRYSCTPDIQKALAGMVGKKVFVFGTGGFGHGATFFEGVLKQVKAHIKPSNEIIGGFMCQGEVASSMRDMVKSRDAAMYETIAPSMDLAVSHPDADDFAALDAAVASAQA